MRSEVGKINIKVSILSTSSFIICLISGIPLAFHYQSQNPLLSVLNIEVNIAFGGFFRNLHYLSAQLTLLFMTLHLFDSIYKGLFKLKRLLSWGVLVLTYPLLLFITFTGYLLRADEMGDFAGTIAENMFLEIPFIGAYLQALLLAKSQVGLTKVYLWHLILSFLVTLGLFIWHIKPKVIFRWENLFYFLWIIPIGVFWKFPLIPFEGEKARGPWFFIGAQQLLKFLSPSLVFFLLLLPVLLLLSYAYLPKYAKILSFFLITYIIIYSMFSIWFFFD